jgi:hypothetical protein
MYNCTILLTITPRATTLYVQGQAAVLKYGILGYLCEAGGEMTGK